MFSPVLVMISPSSASDSEAEPSVYAFRLEMESNAIALIRRYSR
jgi:hypothetical protein